MSDFYASVGALQHELERAKAGLKDVDENIKKLTGKDPTILRSTAGAWRQGIPEDRTYVRNTPRDRRASQGDYGPTAEHRVPGSAFSRLGRQVGRVTRDESADEDEELPNKPRVQSSVVNTPQGIKARKVIAEQQETREAEGRGRNRRMFGLLLGTLQSFRTESRLEQDKTEQRKMIHKKLEQKEEAEKEELQHHTDELFRERRKKRHRLGLLEQKLELVQMHDQWEMETIKLRYFLCTKSEPRIFYMPKIMNETAENKFKYSASIVEGMIDKSRVRLEHEIEELMKEPEEEGEIDHDDEDEEMDDDDDDDGANENGAEPEGANVKSNRIVEASDRTHGGSTRHSRDDDGYSARHSKDEKENPIRHSRDGDENPTRHSRDGAENPTRHSGDGDENPTRHSRDGDENPTRHSRDGDENPTRHSRDGDENPTRHSRDGDENPTRHSRDGDENSTRHSLEGEGNSRHVVEGEKSHSNNNSRKGKDRQEKVRSTEKDKDRSKHRSSQGEDDLNRHSRRRVEEISSKRRRTDSDRRRSSKENEGGEKRRRSRTESENKISDKRSVTIETRSEGMLLEESRLNVETRKHNKSGDSTNRERPHQSPVHETKRDRTHQSPVREKTDTANPDASGETEEKFSSTKAFEKSSNYAEAETETRRPTGSSSVDAFEDRGRRVVLAEDEDEMYPEEASGIQADE